MGFSFVTVVSFVFEKNCYIKTVEPFYLLPIHAAPHLIQPLVFSQSTLG